MFSKKNKGRFALIAVTIVATSVFRLDSLVTFSQSQNQKTDGKASEKKETVNVGKPKEKTVKSKNSSNNDEEQKKGRAVEDSYESMTKQAQNVIGDVFSMSGNLTNPVVRTKIRMLVADAYWNFEPNTAREIVSKDFLQIASISIPQHELELGKVWSVTDLSKPPIYKGRNLEEVKAQLRLEMLTIISARDSTLARSLVAAEKKDEKKDDQAGERRDEVLSTAASLADTDPEAAARIIREGTKSGISDEFPFLLIRLREKSPDEASAIFNQTFSVVRQSADIWGFQKLVPYILPTEKDRLIGGKHYLTDSQRMKDTMTLMDFAVALLSRRLETDPPSSMAPEFVRREFFLWRNLISVFNDVKPENVWLVNARISQLSTVVPQSAQSPVQGPWSDERQKQLIAAIAASTGDKRDDYLESAAFNAWRFGGGDFDQSLSLAERIENKDRREAATGTLYFQAGFKNLGNEGPDKALTMASKIKSPLMRTRLYGAIVSNLLSVKVVERADALREELLNWLGTSESNTETAWGVLEYLESFPNDNPERSFMALDILVKILNSADLNPPDKPLPRKIYWYPEFYEFRKPLAPLARADFEKGLQTIQKLTNNEVAMLIQASFCGEYLKMRVKSKKPPEKPKP